MEVELGAIKECGLAEASLLPALVAQGLGVSPAESHTERGKVVKVTVAWRREYV